MNNNFKKFPDGFLWGAATSAHQVEGNNQNDWSEWELKNATRKRLKNEAKKPWIHWNETDFSKLDLDKFISGRACDHYNLYKYDFALANGLGHNAHRFSIEWSRIEPKEGEWDYNELEHYRDVLKTLKKKNLATCVTLWHWTNPVWLAEKGGWTNKKSVFYFERYIKFIAENLGEDIDIWVVLNEPMVHVSMGYLLGTFPPAKPWSFFSATKAFLNLAQAHKSAHKTIHKIIPEAKVGISQMCNFFEPAHKWCLWERFIAKIARFFHQDFFLRLIEKNMDYIGFSYYFHDRIIWRPPFKKNLNEETTDMGWEIYPEGIYHVAKYLWKKHRKPLYVMENGLADASDEKRAKFIKDHLIWLHKAIGEGVDVNGYFHWSLLDNFEWTSGFYPRFGLVEVDYETMERRVRPSAREYEKICRENSLLL